MTNHSAPYFRLLPPLRKSKIRDDFRKYDVTMDLSIRKIGGTPMICPVCHEKTDTLQCGQCGKKPDTADLLKQRHPVKQFTAVFRAE